MGNIIIKIGRSWDNFIDLYSCYPYTGKTEYLYQHHTHPTAKSFDFSKITTNAALVRNIVVP